MYRHLNLHSCASAPKKDMRAHYTHMYTCSLSHKCTITHSRIQLCSCTHSPINSLSHSFTHSLTHSLAHSLTHALIHLLANIFSLSLTLILYLFVTSMLIQAHLHMLKHILTLTNNYKNTRTDSIMRSYYLILSYIHSYTRVHSRTHTHRMYMHVSLGTRVCACVCVIKQMM